MKDLFFGAGFALATAGLLLALFGNDMWAYFSISGLVCGSIALVTIET